ncbi:MAG: hypothetical protein HC927_05640 [Deltaproteobacteria bacterium]|nr:hypothetical protein [Deltaproteobacteria bacterium]
MVWTQDYTDGNLYTFYVVDSEPVWTQEVETDNDYFGTGQPDEPVPSAIEASYADTALARVYNQHAYPNVVWTCLDAEYSSVVVATLGQLALQHQSCVTGTESQPCTAAAHRHCGSLGHESGYGPIEIAGNLAYVVCTD